MHGLRVPATAKEKGNPLGAPAVKSRCARFCRDPGFSFLFVPASRSPRICFISPFIKKSIKLICRGFVKEIYSGFHYLGRKLELLKIREARAKKDPVQHRKRYEKSSRTLKYRAAEGCAELPPVGP